MRESVPGALGLQCPLKPRSPRVSFPRSWQPRDCIPGMNLRYNFRLLILEQLSSPSLMSGMAKTAWYSGFFSGMIVETWQKAVTDEMTAVECAFLERELELRPGMSVADIACGFGRHSLVLAGRGLHMTGIDVSTEMLDRARQAAGEAGLEIEWQRADMGDWMTDQTFDAAFSVGNSFGYLDREGTSKFLRNVARALRPGGRFAFDYGLAAECILPRFEERQWCSVKDVLFLENNRYDVQRSCVVTEYTMIRDDVVEHRLGEQWVFTVSEVAEMLNRAGFEVVRLCSSHEGDEFRLGAEMLLVVARKAD